jgi:monovalent cation:H+ antiporter-2, CPA2 family
MIFTEHLLIILGASLVATIIFHRFKLPPIVAYIIVGALVGPYLLGWISDPLEFSLIAEFGVAFLLFSIGLEFSMSTMFRLKFAVFGLGSLQVISCFLLFASAVYLWGTTPSAAIVIGGALALSSTAIVSRELSDQQQFNARYAQLSIGVLLFQDLVAVIFLILVPILGSEAASGFTDQILLSIGKGLAFFIILMAAGKWVLPLIYAEVARAKSDEIFGLSTLVIALVTAWLAHKFGLSMALGGFVIGMMLSESPFKHQIVSDIGPFKDVLLGLFFVTVGMNIDLSLIPEYWPRLLLFTVGMLGINTLIVGVIVRFLGESDLVSLRVGIALSQAGEFGLALMTLAAMNGVIPPDQTSFIILIAVLSMLVSPVLIRHSKTIAEKIISIIPGTRVEDLVDSHPVTLHHSGHALIGGFGRVGQTIAHLLDKNGVPYISVDHNMDIVSECRARGDNVIYGDCTRLEILKSCHIQDAKLAVLTFRSLKLAKNTIQEIRRQNIQVPIIARCYEHGNFEELISVGADWVVSEMLEASLIISSQVLSILDIDPHTIEQQLQEVRTSKKRQWPHHS